MLFLGLRYKPNMIMPSNRIIITLAHNTEGSGQLRRYTIQMIEQEKYEIIKTLVETSGNKDNTSMKLSF